MPINECCHKSPSADECEKLDSINGSTKTVESPSVVLGKRNRTDEGNGAAASKIIPDELHLLIQDALKFRDILNRFKDENDSKSLSYGDKLRRGQLERCEDRIRSCVRMLKKEKELPRDWEYDPATASTFVAAVEGTSPTEPLIIPPRRRCCSVVIDPNRIFPKTDNVPLDEEEKKIWTDFKELDKDKVGLDMVNFGTVRKYDIPLVLDNPIVGLTSKFAVSAFNEAIEMYVKKGEPNNIHDFDVVECKYLRLNKSRYYFYITIEAFEERKRGVYDAKVLMNWDDGSKSLMNFALTDRKPSDLKEPTKLRTHPGSWRDCSDIPHTGLRRRRNRRSICRGYDYRTPWGFSGP